MSKSEDIPTTEPAAKAAPEVAPTESAKPASNAMLQMITTMADTTWRMFVPILGLLLIGVYLDKKLGVFPLMTLFGFALGILISALLVRNQLRKGKK